MAAGLRTNGGRHLEYSVRVAASLQCPEADLPVPPYTLGAWLGDGTGQCGSITTVDQEILSEIEAEGFIIRWMPSSAGKAPMYWVEGLGRKLAQAGVRRSLLPRRTGPGLVCDDCVGLGVVARGLCQKCYDARKYQGTLPPKVTGPRLPAGQRTMRADKHIPVVYQRASEGQRRALLAGLLDTDGWCASAGGGVGFAVSREQLARDVHHLVSGLGYKATLTSKPARLYGKDCGTTWTVWFTPADKVFRLSRKLAGQVVTVRATAVHRYVTAVRPVPSVPVRCITVDSPSSLYLAGPSCIPTHNTETVAWNLIAEGITRQDYAALAIDIGKGEQFLGPLRPALHHLATDQDDAAALLAALHRTRLARCNFLAKSHITEWVPGCGLSFLDLFLEEAADVLLRLGTTSRHRETGQYMVTDWAQDVAEARSAGISCDGELPAADERPGGFRGGAVADGQFLLRCGAGGRHGVRAEPGAARPGCPAHPVQHPRAPRHVLCRHRDSAGRCEGDADARLVLGPGRGPDR